MISGNPLCMIKYENERGGGAKFAANRNFQFYIKFAMHSCILASSEFRIHVIVEAAREPRMAMACGIG